MNATVRMVKQHLLRLQSSPVDFEASKHFYNLALFVLLADRDLLLIKRDALTHPDPAVRNLNLRLMAMTIYEFNISKVAGERRVRGYLESMSIPDDVRSEVTAALRSVRKAHTDARKSFTELRNATLAHRDADALLQYRLIRDLREEKVLDVAIQFYDGAAQLLQVLPKVLYLGGSMPGLFSQMRHSAR